VTSASYGQDLEDNLRGLYERLHAGRYRARPTRRVDIGEDGRAATAARHRRVGAARAYGRDQVDRQSRLSWTDSMATTARAQGGSGPVPGAN
jgi:hypothetical protein